MSADVHVVPTENGWRIEVGEGAEGQDFVDRQSAVNAATERAKRDGVELVVHGRDGKIQTRDSFGRDPRQTAG